jgi:hypothetical protein
MFFVSALNNPGACLRRNLRQLPLAEKYSPEYVFIRNRKLALTVGIWCFAFTAFACRAEQLTP